MPQVCPNPSSCYCMKYRRQKSITGPRSPLLSALQIPLLILGLFIVPRALLRSQIPRVRLSSVIWPPKGVCICMYWVCLWVKMWTWTQPDIPIKSMCVGGNVYLCPCFCDEPGTRPGNLLNWVHHSTGDLCHLFLIPVELYLILKP